VVVPKYSIKPNRTAAGPRLPLANGDVTNEVEIRRGRDLLELVLAVLYVQGATVSFKLGMTYEALLVVDVP
jgi:hypothetical protein